MVSAQTLTTGSCIEWPYPKCILYQIWFKKNVCVYWCSNKKKLKWPVTITFSICFMSVQGFSGSSSSQQSWVSSSSTACATIAVQERTTWIAWRRSSPALRVSLERSWGPWTLHTPILQSGRWTSYAWTVTTLCTQPYPPVNLCAHSLSVWNAFAQGQIDWGILPCQMLFARTVPLCRAVEFLMWCDARMCVCVCVSWHVWLSGVYMLLVSLPSTMKWPWLKFFFILTRNIICCHHHQYNYFKRKFMSASTH